MFSKAITAVLLSGFLGGILASGVQMLKVVPLIIQAENYEFEKLSQQKIHDKFGEIIKNDLGVSTNTNTKNIRTEIDVSIKSSEIFHDHQEEIWIPGDGLERNFYTVIFNIASGIGYSLMLVAVYLLRGEPVNIKSGIFWGVVGFIVFSLAPSLGLPPELPGMTAAALEERQFWWIFTVIFTAVGIGIITESKSISPKILAIVFLVLPQIIGAPHPHLLKNPIPTELSAQFVISSLLTSALFWILVGAFSGYFFQKRVQKLTISSQNN